MIKVFAFLLLQILTFFFLFVTSAQAFMTEGDPMHGQILYPINDVNVRLSDISISVERVGGDATATFVLENLDDRSVSFEVVYPVESRCHGCTYIQKDFKVLIDGAPIEYAIFKNLEDTLYDAGYVWTIPMKSKEKKVIKCTFGLGGYISPPVEVMAYRFDNLDRWKGKVDRIHVSLGFERLIDDIDNEDKIHGPSIAISPENYVAKGGSLEWTFDGSAPVSDIDVMIDWSGPILEPSPANKFEGEIIYNRGRIIYKIKGNDPTKEILLAEEGSNAKWSPDGDLIAYFHEPTSHDCQLYTMSYSGQHKKKIENVRCSYDISWSTSGDIIYLNDTYYPVKSYNIETEEFTDVDRSLYSTPECRILSLSPDNDIILCQNSIRIGHWTLGIYKMSNNSVGNLKKIYAKLRKDKTSIIYRDKEYKIIKELDLTSFGNIRWTHDRQKFIVSDDGEIFIYDKSGNQISRYNTKPNIQDWSKNESKLIYCSTCGAEGAIGKLIMIDLKNGDEHFVARGQNLDWFVNELTGINAIKRIFKSKMNYDGNTRLYSVDDLNNELVTGNHDDHQLFVRTLRNEIFARHGREFQSEDLREIFSNTVWYQVNPYYSDDMLNEYERKNVQFIVDHENQLNELRK